MARATTCDVRRGNRWEEIDIVEALVVGSGHLMRCCECHGRVQAHRRGNNGMKEHFEHRVAHKGCSRSTKYNGMDSLHPDALT